MISLTPPVGTTKAATNTNSAYANDSDNHQDNNNSNNNNNNNTTTTRRITVLPLTLAVLATPAPVTVALGNQSQCVPPSGNAQTNRIERERERKTEEVGGPQLVEWSPPVRACGCVCVTLRSACPNAWHL